MTEAMRLPLGTTIVAVPLRRVLAVGAVCGFVPGFVMGCLVGAFASWMAGAAVDWMHQVSFSTGVQVQLMPFGDRVGALQTVRDTWYLVIPAVGAALGLFVAMIGALTAALVATILPGRPIKPEIPLPAHTENHVAPDAPDASREGRP